VAEQWLHAAQAPVKKLGVKMRPEMLLPNKPGRNCMPPSLNAELTSTPFKLPSKDDT
jgi:hypothetical protein